MNPFSKFVEGLSADVLLRILGSMSWVLAILAAAWRVRPSGAVARLAKLLGQKNVSWFQTIDTLADLKWITAAAAIYSSILLWVTLSSVIRRWINAASDEKKIVYRLSSRAASGSLISFTLAYEFIARLVGLDAAWATIMILTGSACMVGSLLGRV